MTTTKMHLGVFSTELWWAPHVPNAGSVDVTVRVVGNATAVLLPLLPLALVAPAILPTEHAEAFLLVLHVLSAELAPVRPLVRPRAVDRRSTPGAPELAPVLADIAAHPADRVVA